MPMRIDILTLFPEMFAGPLGHSIIGRAIAQGLVQIHLHNIRDYARDRHRTVDDTPYGGGAGMVMKADVLGAAIEAVRALDTPSPVTLLTPQGRLFSQALAQEMAGRERLILVCGHYEGVDERVRLLHVDEEISIGDYVLTGGELPAMVVVDAVVRLLPGVLDQESLLLESHHQGLLEHPHYTRPAVYGGLGIPSTLLSGHHAEIARWRREQALRRTLLRRPELLSRAELTPADRAYLNNLAEFTEPAILPVIRERYGRDWTIRVSRKPINPVDAPNTRATRPEESSFACGVCGSTRIECVATGGSGSVASGAAWYEFVCLECGFHTEYRHNQGKHQNGSAKQNERATDRKPG